MVRQYKVSCNAATTSEHVAKKTVQYSKPKQNTTVLGKKVVTVLGNDKVVLGRQVTSYCSGIGILVVSAKFFLL